MKVLLTTHAQMFQTEDGNVWTNSVYGYEFFIRYLKIFDSVRLVTRMKKISYDDSKSKILVSGPNIEFYAIPFYHGPWQYAYKYFSIKKALNEAIDSCDCALLRIPDQLAFQLFNKIKKKNIPCSVEVVAHSWDLYAPGTIKTILRPLLRILWDVNQKKICRRANGVAYVTKDYIQKRYPSKILKNEKRRFETFYTSADLSSVFFDSPRTKTSFDKDILDLVHVSGINNMAKGHSDLLYAIDQLNKNGIKYNLTFVGGGTLLNTFKEKSIKMGLDSQVKFIGHVSKSIDIANILKQSDIFVFPTMTEGLPRVILEAMAIGLPCIASNVGGIPELISSNCLIVPNDVHSLKTKISELSIDKESLITESENNYRNVMRNYAPKVIENKRNVFYKHLIMEVRRT